MAGRLLCCKLRRAGRLAQLQQVCLTSMSDRCRQGTHHTVQWCSHWCNQWCCGFHPQASRQGTGPTGTMRWSAQLEAPFGQELVACGEVATTGGGHTAPCVTHPQGLKDLSVPICSYLYLPVPIYTYLYLSIPIDTYMYLSVSICTYLYLSIPICTYLYLSIPICTYVYLCILIYTCLCLSIPICTCLYLSISICTCLYLSIPICTFYTYLDQRGDCGWTSVWSTAKLCR